MTHHTVLTSVTSIVRRRSATVWDLSRVLKETCMGSTVCFWKSTFTLHNTCVVKIHKNQVSLKMFSLHLFLYFTRKEHFLKISKPAL